MNAETRTAAAEDVSRALLRILIVGGYGMFGGRLADLLADEPRLTLLIAGRSRVAAEAFCKEHPGSVAKLLPVTFDREGDLKQQLASFAPDLVVDASGPFQGYIGDPYALPRACIDAGCDYIDLADATAFVAGIGVLDTDAKRAGRFVLSGASSFPTLSAAVVRHLAVGLDHVDAIAAGVAPSPYAGIGFNVISAIASYAGKPVQIRADGQRVTRPGFVDSRRMTIAVPGRVPLPAIRFGLADVPDLEVLATDWPRVQSIWVGAGPRPALMHRTLWAAGKLVHWRLLPSLAPLAPLMHRAVSLARWGEHRGGMIVAVDGRLNRMHETRSWHLIADGDRGPYIPSTAAEILIRQRLAGRPITSGARSAHRELELADFEAAFARRGIVTGYRLSPETDASPYEVVLGQAYGTLPPPIQDLHRFGSDVRYAGRARVTGADNAVARIIAWLFGFPPAAADCTVTVDLSRRHGVETWRRSFAGRAFRSSQEAGKGRDAHLIVERFGPLAFGLAVVATQERLDLHVRRWTAFGVPMPRALAPRVTAFEHATAGRFNFSVDLGLPLIGRLVRYEGWLKPELHKI